MRYPPDEWSILPEDRFATHVVDDAEQSLTADVLLQVSRNAKLEGCFKIQLGGSEILHADCPAKESDGLVKKNSGSKQKIPAPDLKHGFLHISILHV